MLCRGAGNGLSGTGEWPIGYRGMGYQMPGKGPSKQKMKQNMCGNDMFALCRDFSLLRIVVSHCVVFFLLKIDDCNDVFFPLCGDGCVLI